MRKGRWQEHWGKNREEAVLPLHPDMLAVLKDKLAGLKPTDRVFHPVPNILTYQRDLERVGIEYKDENGRYLDFHSLRGTFATRLLRHGVHPSKAIRLTRHKSVKTLETYYDMLGLTDAEDAMGQLPGLGSSGNGDEAYGGLGKAGVPTGVVHVHPLAPSHICLPQPAVGDPRGVAVGGRL